MKTKWLWSLTTFEGIFYCLLFYTMAIVYFLQFLYSDSLSISDCRTGTQFSPRTPSWMQHWTHSNPTWRLCLCKLNSPVLKGGRCVCVCLCVCFSMYPWCCVVNVKALIKCELKLSRVLGHCFSGQVTQTYLEQPWCENRLDHLLIRYFQHRVVCLNLWVFLAWKIHC